MTLTSIILAVLDWFLLVPGLSLLNWVFLPPNAGLWDLLLMFITILCLLLFAAWGASLAYGVEHL